MYREKKSTLSACLLVNCFMIVKIGIMLAKCLHCVHAIVLICLS